MKLNLFASLKPFLVESLRAIAKQSLAQAYIRLLPSVYNDKKSVVKMNLKLFFFCLIFAGYYSFGNAQVISEIPDTTAKLSIVIPKTYELTSDQWNAWQKIEQEWMKKEYSKILKENQLKMNCNGCESVYMDAVFSIDSTGKLKYYKLINSKKCADTFSKGLEIRFTKWFFHLLFPPELYNLNFEVRLGTGLKC